MIKIWSKNRLNSQIASYNTTLNGNIEWNKTEETAPIPYATFKDLAIQIGSTDDDESQRNNKFKSPGAIARAFYFHMVFSKKGNSKLKTCESPVTQCINRHEYHQGAEHRI